MNRLIRGYLGVLNNGTAAQTVLLIAPGGGLVNIPVQALASALANGYSYPANSPTIVTQQFTPGTPQATGYFDPYTIAEQAAAIQAANQAAALIAAKQFDADKAAASLSQQKTTLPTYVPGQYIGPSESADSISVDQSTSNVAPPRVEAKKPSALLLLLATAATFYLFGG
jgi:hypothetical protein